MGHEYKVRFETEDQTQVDGFLRSLSGFTEFDGQWDVYRYREETNTGKMPSAEIKLEEDGIYFCDYGLSRQSFGLILWNLLSQFGKIQIEDYE